MSLIVVKTDSKRAAYDAHMTLHVQRMQHKVCVFVIKCLSLLA